MMRFELAALALTVVSVCSVGCSSSEPASPAPVTDGGVVADVGVVPDVGGSDTGGELGSGKATMEATFTDPVDGYNGVVTPYAGLEAESKAGGSDGFFQFDTSSANGLPLRRGVFLAVRGTPVAGMTFATTNDKIPPGTSIRYQEVDFPSTTRVFSCVGSITFDSITGSIHKFHFTGKCTNPGIGGSGKGGVTINGSGVGNVK